MDSMRQALRDALDDARHPEANQASDAAEDDVTVRFHQCSKCNSVSAPGNKLRYCGRCETKMYCSKSCAQADWAEHKLSCENLRKSHGEALAAFEAQGGRKQDFHKNAREVLLWFDTVPGLRNEINLLAWASRSKSPVIYVSIFEEDVQDGSEIRVQMFPRSFWDEDPQFLDMFSSEFRESLCQRFGEASFCPNEVFVCGFTIEQRGPGVHTIWIIEQFIYHTVRGAEIVEALTAAIRAEDLTDAFDWIEKNVHSGVAQYVLQHLRDRSISVHGSTTPQGSVPFPSRALNNEVAYMIMNILNIEFDIRLTGLCGAVHLNGREGVIRGIDPANHERFKARLEDRTYVSVKAVHFMYIRRGDYKRKSP